MARSSTDILGKRRAKFVVGVAVVALVVSGLIVWAMALPGSTSFYYTTTEALGLAREAAGAEEYRVNGRVVPGSIRRDGLETTFAMTDGRTALTVVTDQPLPDAFRDRSEVIARGRLDGKVFAAVEVLAKCPSKFKARA